MLKSRLGRGPPLPRTTQALVCSLIVILDLVLQSLDDLVAEVAEDLRGDRVELIQVAVGLVLSFAKFAVHELPMIRSLVGSEFLGDSVAQVQAGVVLVVILSDRRDRVLMELRLLASREVAIAVTDPRAFMDFTGQILVKVARCVVDQGVLHSVLVGDGVEISYLLVDSDLRLA